MTPADEISIALSSCRIPWSSIVSESASAFLSNRFQTPTIGPTQYDVRKVAPHVGARTLSYCARKLWIIDDPSENLGSVRDIRIGPDLILEVRVFAFLHGLE